MDTTRKSSLPLPTPFAGPAPLPTLHNATAYEQAVALARQMAARHARGEYNDAMDAQARDTIDGLVGRVVDEEVVWPSALIEISGTSQRRAAK
jgi:hypothetical protein